MPTILAFVRRDVSMALSYRTSFALQLVGILLTISVFYFLSQFLETQVGSSLDIPGGDYFAFILVGLAFTRYMTLSMTTFSSSIREGQMMGTLEIMLLSPTRLSKILLSSSIWAYVFTSIQIVVFILLGVAVFGMSLTGANYLTAAAILVLSIASFAAIGIISASIIVVLKKGDPIAWAITGVSTLLAGVYFPIYVLPDWLESLSWLLPLRYTLDGMRSALLEGNSLQDCWVQLVGLTGFAVVLLPLAFLCFRYAVRRARVEGTLVHY